MLEMLNNISFQSQGPGVSFVIQTNPIQESGFMNNQNGEEVSWRTKMDEGLRGKEASWRTKI